MKKMDSPRPRIINGGGVWSIGSASPDSTRIATEKDRVCDRFYVKGRNGLKITSVDETAVIRKRLTGAFSLLHR